MGDIEPDVSGNISIYGMNDDEPLNKKISSNVKKKKSRCNYTFRCTLVQVKVVPVSFASFNLENLELLLLLLFKQTTMRVFSYN